MKNYKWKTEYKKIFSKYNSSKYYQYGDLLWKLHDKSVEAIGENEIMIVKVISCNE